MKALPQSALNYLNTQRVGVLSVEMLDGSPHGATVHFTHTEEPFVFYFETHKESRKAESFKSKDNIHASFVVGSNESNMKTLQMDGNIQLVSQEENASFESIYFSKFAEKEEKVKAKKSEILYLKFIPTWWRFTDWTTPEGKMIIVSE